MNLFLSPFFMLKLQDCELTIFLVLQFKEFSCFSISRFLKLYLYLDYNNN